MKKVTLNVYTHDQRIIDYQPLEIRNKPPAWWHKLKKTFNKMEFRSGIRVPTPTVRACPGIVDFVRKPIVFRMWTDAIFKVNPDGTVTTATPLHGGGELEIGVHDDKQYGELYPNHTVCKLHNPWLFKGSDSTDFLCTDVHYDTEFRKHGMFICPGIVNFNDQHAANIFIAFPTKKESYEVTLKYDQPLMAMFPMTDKKIDIKMNKIEKHERATIINAFPATFLGRYYTRKHARRK